MNQNLLSSLIEANDQWISSKGKHGARAILKGTEILKLDLSSSNLRGVDLDRAVLNGSNCSKTDFTGAKIRNASFDSCRLMCATLDNAKLNGSSFKNAKMSGAFLRSVKSHWADYSSASMHKVVATSAVFDHSNILRANLYNSDLQDSRFFGCNLHGANLADANLRNANLSQSVLSEANLDGACITGVVLSQTLTENWSIKNIDCDYVYFDYEKQKRIPRDRKFKAKEFEELYSWFPGFVYFFKDEMHALDPYVISLIVESLNETTEDIHLRIDELRGRGLYPQLKLSVMGSDDVDNIEAVVTEIIDNSLIKIRNTIEFSENRLEEFIKQTIDNATQGISMTKLTFNAPVQSVVAENHGTVYVEGNKIDKLPEFIEAVKTVEAPNELQALAKKEAVKELTKLLAGDVKELTGSTAAWIKQAFLNNVDALPSQLKDLLNL